MILVEKNCCNDKLQAFQKKRYYIELFKASLNLNVPIRTVKEYRELNKDKLIEYQKNYQEENQEKIKAINKEYYEQNKDKIKEKKK